MNKQNKDQEKINRAEALIYKEILQESKENFTEDFQLKVLEVIRKIGGM